jgi:hypothetical protein
MVLFSIGEGRFGDDYERIQGYLKRGIQELARRFLGPEFEVRIQEVEPGSIVAVTIIIGTIGVGVYKTVKDYENFINGLKLLRTHTEQLVNSFLGDFATSSSRLDIASNVSPGPALYSAGTLLAFGSAVNQLRNFLLYISISTSLLLIAILVCVLILVFR